MGNCADQNFRYAALASVKERRNLDLRKAHGDHSEDNQLTYIELSESFNMMEVPKVER